MEQCMQMYIIKKNMRHEVGWGIFTQSIRLQIKVKASARNCVK
jgi:hypothetical protein